MRVFFPLLIAVAASFLVLVSTAFAQERDSVFTDYGAYSKFVDQHIQERNFIPLIQSLGGRDEFTIEQLSNINRNLLGAFQVNFKNTTVFRQEDLGGGLRQEGRIYWTGESYAFYYALLHQRPDDLTVITFFLNSSASEIMSKF